MAAVKDFNVDEKLKSLFQLQKIDSKIDEIKTMRGELPMEVRDLEDELVGLQTRMNHLETELADAEQIIANYKTAKKEAESLVKKYEKQQDNVKNNREFEALKKEIELQKLEAQLAEKRSKEAAFDVAAKQEAFDKAKELYKEREKSLKVKKGELDQVIEETEAEEAVLAKKSKAAREHIDERLLLSYDKIRRNYRNGTAVASIQRGACGGCYNVIPPQRQLEIRMHKKVIACEHCGRILVDEIIDK